tara:strand:- start:6841 stop:7437 length:597 start_codon:yes stop_codon:yes gene_type:complete
MFIFKNDSKAKPFIRLKKEYKRAIAAKQFLPEAICISSYLSLTKEVNSRYVNLKFIDNESFIFFSNYNSPKAIDFSSHTQISAVLFWSSINVQIRMKAKIKKTSKSFNQKYFSIRSKEKNALAISSNQSKSIESYSQIIENYNASFKNDNLKKCPKYWGGFSFIPYEIEFWEGNEFRINKRSLYKKNKNSWDQFILEP